MKTSIHVYKFSHRYNIISWGVVSGILAVFTVKAESCYLQAENSVFLFCLKALVYFFSFFITGLVTDCFYRNNIVHCSKRSKKSTGSIVLLAGTFFIIYLLWLFVYYPGVCGWDTVNQIADLITGTEPMPFSWISGQAEISALMNDHHPVFTTVIFTLFYKIGEIFFASANTGMFLYCLLQITVQALLFAYSVSILWEKGVPRFIISGCIILYIQPFVAFFSIAMLKDSVFSLSFLLYYINYIEIFDNLLQKTDTEKRNIYQHILFSVLVALSNKKGLYITSLSNLILIIPALKCNKNSFYLIMAALVPFVLVSVIMGKILFPALDIYPGGKQEALGLAIQQTSKAIITHPETFSTEDSDVYYRVISVSRGTVSDYYQDSITDGIKSQFNFYATADDIRDFIFLWIKQGVYHPRTYLNALLSVCGGYFAPVKTINIYSETTYNSWIHAFSQPENLGMLRTTLTDFYNWIAHLPMLTFLFQDCLYCWFIPVLIFALLVFNQKVKYTIMLVPIVANIVFLFIGPVCWSRYGLCQIYTIPCVLGIPFRSCSSSIKH